ncbi:hypothetical protein BGZ93_007016 [Podila epicladia]|nr:hypothetical protein BGZ93_007016 [Podila epicladia]
MSFRRQRPILPEPARNLITHVTGFNTTDMHFESYSNYVATQLFDIAGIGGNRNKSVDHMVINQRIEGLADKLSMKNQDSKADALREYLVRIRGLARAVGDIEQSRSISAIMSTMDQEESAQNALSSVLLMLLELSESPAVQPKGVYGYSMPDHLKRDQRTPKTEKQINREIWQAILKEDPLVGDHWAQRDVDDQDIDDSDFEDMDVDERAGPSVSSERKQGSLNDKFYSDSQGPSSLDFWSAATPYNTLRKGQSGLLKVLKQQQYWKGQELVPKTVSTTLRSEESMFDLQDATLLNRMLRESRSDFGEVILLEEVDIIHEVFLLLLGLPTTIFITKADSRPVLEPTVTLSHLSQGALLAILQPFAECAFTISSLQSEVDQICSAPTSQYGKVIQAFASAVHSELQDLKGKMSDFQQMYQKYRISTEQRLASLIELQTTLQPCMRTATTLFNFWKQCPFSGSPNTHEQKCAFSIHLLSQLYDNITHTTLCGDSSSSALYNRILQQCMQPFLNNMESWLSGQPVDLDSESMIKPSQDVEQLSNDFWSHGFQYQTRKFDGDDGVNETLIIEPSLPPPASGFSSTVMSRIAGVGVDKQSQIGYEQLPTTHQQHYSQVSSLQYPLPPSFSGSHGLSEAYREMSTETNVCGIDFESRVEIELQRAIEEQYVQANTLLKSVLFTQSYLLWHLRGMDEFYFMLQGNVMHWFSAAMFSKIQRRHPWCDNYILGSTFNQIASECNWPFKQFVKVRVKDPENIKSKLGGYSLAGLRASMLEQVEFEYLLPWPLAGIVYSKDHTKQMYSRIATLLFQVKIAKLTLEQPAFLKFKGSGIGTLRKLRLRFLSTLNDLWSYLMTTVLDSQIKKFHSEVEEQGDLDDIIHLCQRTINICYERCFLRDRAQPLLRTLITILNLALKFSAIFTAFIQEAEKAKKMQDSGTQAPLISTSSKTDVRSHKSRSGRRVSFTVNGVAGSSVQGQRIGVDLSSSDSEDDDEGLDSEMDVSHRQGMYSASAPKTLLFSQSDVQDMDEDDEDDDGDLDVDSRAFMDRAKKQRTGTDLSVPASYTSSSAGSQHERGRDDGFDDRLPRSPRKKRPPHVLSKSPVRRRSGSRSRTRAEHEGSTLERLEAIEREFTRCRDFLAKSLRVVVNSNAARGYNASRRLLEGGVMGAGDDVGSGEGGSDYLEGLILSLLS